MDACNFGKYRALLFNALVVVDMFLFIVFPFLWGFSAWPINTGNNALSWARDN